MYGLQQIEQRAELMSQYWDALGTTDGLERDRRRYLDATVEGVQKVAAEVLRGHRHVLTIVPLPAAPPLPAKPGAAPPTPSPAPKKEAH